MLRSDGDRGQFRLIARGAWLRWSLRTTRSRTAVQTQSCSERHVGPTDVSYNTFDRNHKDIDSDAFFCMNYGGTAITTLQKVSHNTIDMGVGTTFTNATRGTAITFLQLVHGRGRRVHERSDHR